MHTCNCLGYSDIQTHMASDDLHIHLHLTTMNNLKWTINVDMINETFNKIWKEYNKIKDAIIAKTKEQKKKLVS